MDDPAELTAGYREVQLRAGRGYQGVLRRTPGSKPVWTCRHDSHLSAVSAKSCAQAELTRRVQGKGAVFTLLHCRRCTEGGGSAWWDDVPGAGSLACPRCGVPLERLKLVVTECGPAS